MFIPPFIYRNPNLDTCYLTLLDPIKTDGKLHSDSAKKADLLNNQFQSVFGAIEPDERLPNVSGKSYLDMLDLHITVEGVEKQLRNSVSSKASGPDQIPNMHLKTTAEQTAPILTLIFNQSLQTGELPSDWLSANVSPIFKKGDKHTAANYRPVSLTCVCCKLLEHCIVRHIRDHLDN